MRIVLFGAYGDIPKNDLGIEVELLTQSRYSSIKQLPSIVWAMIKYAVRNPADIWIAADFPTITAFGFLPFKGRKVAVLYGTELRGTLFLYLNRLRLYRPLGWFDRMVAISQYTRSLALKYNPYLNDGRLIAAHLGTEEGWFDRASDKEVAELRSELEIGADRHILLTVGRVERRKGIEYSIRAVQALPDDVRGKVTYLIAGREVDQAYAASLRSALTEGDADIRFLGTVSSETLRKLYAGAYALLHTAVPQPINVEGFGLVLVEAAAQKLPIIATYTDAIPEVVADGKSGILVEPQDCQAIGEAICSLVRDRGLRDRMAEAGPDHARTFSWDRHVKALLGPARL